MYHTTMLINYCHHAVHYIPSTYLSYNCDFVLSGTLPFPCLFALPLVTTNLISKYGVRFGLVLDST